MRLPILRSSLCEGDVIALVWSDRLKVADFSHIRPDQSTDTEPGSGRRAPQ